MQLFAANDADEFSSVLRRELTPKILITTNRFNSTVSFVTVNLSSRCFIKLRMNILLLRIVLFYVFDLERTCVYI